MSVGAFQPIKTEKSMHAAGSGVFTFVVNRQTTKTQAKNVIERMFGVNVVQVRMVSAAGKTRKFGKIIKQLSDRKKAVVTLKKGQTIDLFDTEKKKQKSKKKGRNV